MTTAELGGLGKCGVGAQAPRGVLEEVVGFAEAKAHQVGGEGGVLRAVKSAHRDRRHPHLRHTPMAHKLMRNDAAASAHPVGGDASDPWYMRRSYLFGQPPTDVVIAAAVRAERCWHSQLGRVAHDKVRAIRDGRREDGLAQR